MKKIVIILFCLLCVGLGRSYAQNTPNGDSLRRVQFEKRRDSIAAVMQKRQQERIRIQDSIRKAKKADRDRVRKQHKDFTNRKKERERIRDSVEKERKNAAAARKAYLKSLKKQKKKKTSKKSPEVKKQKTKKTPAKKKKEEKKKLTKTKKKKTTNNKAEEKKKPKPKKKKKRRKRKEFQNVFKKEKKPKKKKEKKQKVITEKKAKKAEPIKVKKKQKLEKQPAKKAAEPNDKKEAKKEKKKKSPVAVEKGRTASVIRSSLTRLPPSKKMTQFSFQFGPSVYLGDLGGNSALDRNLLGNINFKERTYFYGFALTHLRHEAVGIRLSYVFGKIAGSDKNTYFKSVNDPSYSRFVRNLDFQSSISEGSLMLELHPLKFLSHKTKLHHLYLQPYALIGIGRYSFNPQGSYYDEVLDDNVWVDLQPLSTEGQGFAEYSDRTPYELSQWNIPYGFGFNYEISPSIKLGLEVVGRKLFTDYLDDVSTNFIDPNLYDNYFTPENAELAKILNNKSKLIDAEKAYKPGQQRGNPNNNDLYFSINGRLIIKLNRNKKKKESQQELFKYDDNEICD